MKFRYEGYDRAANIVRGEMDATNEAEVRRELRGQSISPRSIVSIRSSISLVESFTGGGGKPNLKNFTMFIRQWATMQSAGLTLIQCLQVLSEQSIDKKFAVVISQLGKSIQEGQTLSQSLQRHKGVFDKVFINLVSAGETSGTLDRILERLATYYEKTAALKRKIVTASMYPTVILCIITMIVIGLLVFVVPVFQKMYGDQGQTLPGPTLMLIAISGALRNHIAIMIGGLVAIVVLGFYLLTNEEAREKVDPFLLMIPVFGDIMMKSCLARFSRTLGTLIQAGVPILDAFALAGKTAGNYTIEQAVMRTQGSIREGSTISQPLSTEKAIPRMVVSMIAVGEQTGELEKMLIKIAEFYEDEVDTTVSGLTSILEPIMILVMGAVVVSVLVPLYLPIFKMGDIMGK